MRMNTSQHNVKIVESCGPYFGSHTRHKPVKMKPANQHGRTTTENQEENSRLMSVLFLSPSDILFLFVQLVQVTQFSYSVSFS